jgi:Zn finger protein HypA/HybF involved in hydrogenase expression
MPTTYYICKNCGHSFETIATKDLDCAHCGSIDIAISNPNPKGRWKLEDKKLYTERIL